MTFRVDGVSYRFLLERARKSIDLPHVTPTPEWEQKCEAKARAEFPTAKRTPLNSFNTPSPMQQFLAMCAAKPDEFRDLVCMEQYDTGARDPKTKEPVTAWRPYTGAAAPTFSLTTQEAAA